MIDALNLTQNHYTSKFNHIVRQVWASVLIRKLLSNEGLPLALVVAVGLLLRLLLATSPQVDIDEGFAYAPASLAYLGGNWAVNYEHPMLIKLIFAGSITLFGSSGKFGSIYPWLPESIGAIRLISSLMGAGTVAVIYSLAKRVTGSRSCGLIAAIQLSFDPIALAESSYGLLDPGMTFFYMSSILFFYRFVQGGARKNFWISAVFFGMAVASKYFAFMAIFVGIVVLAWKRKLLGHVVTGAVYLCIAAVIFFAIQPYFWHNTVGNIWLSLDLNWIHLNAGHWVKPPGNPFLIPEVSYYGQPWPHVGSSPIASKPEFASNLSSLIPPPWWYNIYILVMYSTPFEIAIFALAAYQITKSMIRRRVNDLIVLSSLLFLTPNVYFALQSVRLPQYTILLSTSATLLTPTLYVGLKKKLARIFLILLASFHAIWTIGVLLIPGGTFTGWGFYVTPLTPVLAGLFHWLLTVV